MGSMTITETLYCLRHVPLLLGLLVFVCFWGGQFLRLMSLSDSWFPGRYDKVLWAVAFLVAFPVAPFLFLTWDPVQNEKGQEEHEEAGAAP